MAGVPGCPGCKELNKRIQELERRIDTLQRQVDKLVGALEKSRRAGKRQAAPFSKGKPKAEPKKPGRKPGKDYGRAGRRAIPRQVDEVLDAPLPHRCTDCAGAVVEDRIEKQYQTEIPPVKPLVRGFDVHVGHCERCGKRFQGRHPQQTSDALGAAASQLGPRVVAFSAWLHQVLGLPYGKASDLLSEVYGIDVTPGGLVQAHARLARRGGPAYDHLLDEIRQSAAVDSDGLGFKPHSAASSQSISVGSTSSRLIFAIGRPRRRSCSARTSRSNDLPLPDGPITATNSPGATRKSTPRRASTATLSAR